MNELRAYDAERAAHLFASPPYPAPGQAVAPLIGGPVDGGWGVICGGPQVQDMILLGRWHYRRGAGESVLRFAGWCRPTGGTE